MTIQIPITGSGLLSSTSGLQLSTGSIPANSATSVNGFGSSITVGFGLSSPSTQNYFALTCAKNGWVGTNNAISGSGIADQITSINGITQAVGNINVVETGINDSFTGGSSVSYQAQYQAGLLYALVSAGLPDVNKFWANNAAISYVNWSSSTTVFGQPFKFTSTIGATATATVNGSAVYVGGLTQQTNDSTLSVTVDGINYGNIVNQGANASPLSSFNWPYAIRIGGLFPGPHTVVVTYASGTNNGGISFIAGNGGLTANAGNAFNPSGPSTYVVNAIQAANRTGSGEAPYNNIINIVSSQLARDGVNVVVVDAASAFNGTLAANINAGASNHPSAVGQQVLANSLQAVLSPAATPMDRQRVPVLASPFEVASVNLTAQSAAISATTIATASQTGMYRISWSAAITTADGVSSTLGGSSGFQILYTSPTDSVSKTTVSGNSVTSAANTTGTALGGEIVIYAQNGTVIQYQYGYTSNTPGQMIYELHIKLETM
jgi:hypothetical protein